MIGECFERPLHSTPIRLHMADLLLSYYLVAVVWLVVEKDYVSSYVWVLARVAKKIRSVHQHIWGSRTYLYGFYKHLLVALQRKLMFEHSAHCRFGVAGDMGLVGRRAGASPVPLCSKTRSLHTGWVQRTHEVSQHRPMLYIRNPTFAGPISTLQASLRKPKWETKMRGG